MCEHVYSFIDLLHFCLSIFWQGVVRCFRVLFCKRRIQLIHTNSVHTKIDLPTINFRLRRNKLISPVHLLIHSLKLNFAHLLRKDTPNKTHQSLTFRVFGTSASCWLQGGGYFAQINFLLHIYLLRFLSRSIRGGSDDASIPFQIATGNTAQCLFATGDRLKDEKITCRLAGEVNELLLQRLCKFVLGGPSPAVQILTKKNNPGGNCYWVRGISIRLL